ncbi:MAG: helicase-exonuclease AddAB subunit AddA [Clostridia bacterium]|nr:helicase-exonuclease AddAB subunit AddA [Clostridia bacterium]
MSQEKLTTEQINAMTIRGKNLLVSAGAGSGKTFVLVNRIINQISDENVRMDIDKLLVMTFTNAAAYEMKERIRSALYRKINENPGDSHLARQLLLINRAMITTIHSFCSDIIRSNYHLVDIDPSFSICDETRSNQLKAEALKETLLDYYENDSQIFRDLLNAYGSGNDDRELSSLVLKLHKFLMSTPDPLLWLEEKLSLYHLEEDDFFLSSWGKEIREYTGMVLDGICSSLKNALELISDSDDYKGYEDALISDFNGLDAMKEKIRQCTYDEFIDDVNAFSFIRLGRNSKQADKDICDLIKEIRNSIKGEYSRIKSFYINDSSDQKAIFNHLNPLLSELSSVVVSFKNKYDELKRSQSLLDFNDLEHMSLQCLKNGAAYEYRNRFNEILVDEYQDSNLVQEEIINLIKKSNNLFLVGDVKQSIYKFRNANPDLFMNKYHRYSPDEDDAKDHKIELNRNFRSRNEILSFVNFVFERTMSKGAGDLDYGQGQYLNYGASYKEDEKIACEILIASGDEKIFNEHDSKYTLEAAMIASKIQDLMQSSMKVLDKNSKQLRPIRYSDIVILLRTIKTVSAEFVSTFRKYDIPVFADQELSFFENDEVSRVINVLSILDNPYQDIPLLSIMMSHFYHFTDKEMVVLTSKNKSDSIYEAILAYAEPDAIKEKIDHMLKSLDHFMYLSTMISIDKLIWLIITETGYFYEADHGSSLLSKQNNLRRLFEIAGQYEKNNENSLFSFLNYVSEHVEGTSDLAGASTFGENDDVIRIISIHKSKGLEYPVVFVSNCSKQFNNQDSRESVLFHRDLGFGPEYVSTDESYRFSPVTKRIIAQKIKNENISEELRILYVALTRAREKLYITGQSKDIEKSCSKWSFLGRGVNKISSSSILNCQCYLDWIMAALSSHEKGNVINENAGMTREHLTKEPLDFTIHFQNADEIISSFSTTDALEFKKGLSCLINQQEVEKRFNWRYPFENEINLYRKISVTEMKKLKERSLDSESGELINDTLIEKPDFMEGYSTIDRALRGTMVHNLMAYIDFKKVFEQGYLEKCIDGMGLEEDVIPLIQSLFKDEIGQRMMKAEILYREKSFMLPMKTVDIYGELKGLISEDHQTMIQGVIDCMFIEDDQVVIIDYKTDYVKPGQEQEKADVYQVQLDLYAKAVEEILQKKVKQKVIFLLHTGKALYV